MFDFLTGQEDLILELVALILTTLIGAAAQALRRWTGIEIEARHREALHAALMSGVRAAIEAEPDARGPVALQAIVNAALRHAQASVPDAIRALKPSQPVLDSIARRYASEAMERVVTSAAFR